VQWQRIWKNLPQVGDANLMILSDTRVEMRSPDSLMGWCFRLMRVTRTYRGEWTDHKGYLADIESGCISYINSTPLKSFFNKLGDEIGVTLNEFMLH
jgi:hypothetical protein